MTRITIALFNYQDGGWREGRGYRFGPLQRAFADVDEPPALILFCEARGYRDHAGTAGYAAAEALSDKLGVPYVVELGRSDRGPMPPAIFYDPTVLTLRSWCGPGDPDGFRNLANSARFAVRGNGPDADGRVEFGAWVQHWDPVSGDARLEEARRTNHINNSIAVIGGGDLNGTASGKHLPQRDWMAVPFPARDEKGIVGADGRWGPDTRAVDHLIGRWDEDRKERKDGSGWHAVAEMAWQQDPATPLLPTVNDGVDAGGGLLIDLLLVNDAMRPFVVPASYKVHVPEPGEPHPSDHRLVTVALELPGPALPVPACEMATAERTGGLAVSAAG